MDHHNEIFKLRNESSKFIYESLPSKDRPKYETFRTYLRVYFEVYDRLIGERKKAECRLLGWTVNLGKDQYYRAFKKYRGKLYAVYLGKHFDTLLAVEKIKRKMAEVGIE
jgi:hypothetical protein